jgi:1-acyl-sn-glycerol-3-phosphate acyltransferase
MEKIIPYHLPWWRRWIARPLVRLVLGSIFRVLAPVRIMGKENIPYGQAYIVAFNHVSLFDPPFLGVFWPEHLEAMGAVDIWSRPGQNILVRLWGGIPVHRGEYDRELFDTVISALQSGHPLMIAPEGGRSHSPGLHQAKPGIAFITEKIDVPILPVGIVGTTDDFMHKASRGKRPTLEMYIGKPLHLPAMQGRGEERRQARQANADMVMQALARLLPDEYRGFYSFEKAKEK